MLVACARARASTCVACPVYARSWTAPRLVHTAVGTWERQRQQLATLHDALAQRHAQRAMDAFIALARQPTTVLTPVEFRGMLHVLLGTRPHTQATVEQVLLVVEHIQHAQQALAKTPDTISAADALVQSELVYMLQDAFLWNSLLTCIRPQRRRSAFLALQDMLDLLARAAVVTQSTAMRDTRMESAKPGHCTDHDKSSAHADQQHGTTSAWTSACMPLQETRLFTPPPSYTPMAGIGTAPYRAFPDTVTYNFLLHALVQCGTGQPNDRAQRRRQRQRRRWRRPTTAVPATILAPALQHTLQMQPLTPRMAVQCFDDVWTHMSRWRTTQPSSVSWCIRLTLYTRLGQLERVHDCMRQMETHRMLTIDAIHVVLHAYAKLSTDATPALHVRCVYEVLRYAALCRELGGQGASGRSCTSMAHPHALQVDDATMDAWCRVTGLTSVPDNLALTPKTYATVTRLLAEHDDLYGALHVLHDGLESKSGSSRSSNGDGDGDGDGMQGPTLAVYHSLLGVLARRKHTTRESEPILAELIEGYLRVKPSGSCASPAPSPRQIATVLRAVWRVHAAPHSEGSGTDDTTSREASSMYMADVWTRLVAKFSTPPWHGFRVDTHVRRLLQHANVRVPTW